MRSFNEYNEYRFEVLHLLLKSKFFKFVRFCNSVGIIPASFGNLINLEELSISGNHISGIIPTELQNYYFV